MIKFCKYENKDNCIIRTFSKIFNKNNKDIYNELCNIKEKLNCNSYTDICVFEKYLKEHHYKSVNNTFKQVKDITLNKGKYVIFCWNCIDYYHMIPMIDGIIYDKNIECMDLYIIKIYKKIHL